LVAFNNTTKLQVFVHHATFCVNSLAHYVGSHTYADNHTPRDHFVTALVTLGEGYHNFHHEFPQDYRNAIRWFQVAIENVAMLFCLCQIECAFLVCLAHSMIRQRCSFA
jgi:fatty-acid desaturase